MLFHAFSSTQACLPLSKPDSYVSRFISKDTFIPKTHLRVVAPFTKGSYYSANSLGAFGWTNGWKFSVTVAYLLRHVQLFWDPMVYSPPGSHVHGILNTEYWILKWVAISFSRGSSQPRDQICVSLSRWILYHWATRKATHTQNLTNSPLHMRNG